MSRRVRALAEVLGPRRPNVVLVVLDDMSMDLLRTMRSARRMRDRGAWYPHSYVVDSLCCVSRASTFTRQYPHQTGVRLNVSVRDGSDDPRGGWPAFARHGNRRRTVAVRLQRSGYTTGYVGKYLNEDDYRGGRRPATRPAGRRSRRGPRR
jgi:N-acetylglucosamine-6-sulfatase